MMKKIDKIILIPIFFLFLAMCSQNSESSNKTPVKEANKKIITGAEQLNLYLPLLENKKVALVVNQTSRIKHRHLVDVLLEKKIEIKKIFAPEHGFRGKTDRGVSINDSIDEKTQLPIIALFGKTKKPNSEHLENIDVVIFDIQDAGARFFTYISTMHNVMEACAENHKKLIILDRPNPLGDYVDGPVRKPEFKSFVGMHAIPIVHGLTVGELAQMINGEKWLENGIQCEIEIIKIKNYTHSIYYSLPVKPSPNLPNDLAIRLYPSLCFFEATEISVGRGTQFPFQVIAYPDKRFGYFSFTPQDIEGMQMNPIQEGQKCYGIDLRNLKPADVQFSLKYLIEFYNKADFKDSLISNPRWFNLLAGNSQLLEQIKAGMNEKEIKASWEKELLDYKEMRRKYLLYENFE